MQPQALNLVFPPKIYIIFYKHQTQFLPTQQLDQNKNIYQEKP